MVKVYYEQAGYAQLVAYFDDENTYNKCIEVLEQDAQENNFEFITESINELDLSEVDDIIEPILNDEKTKIENLIIEKANLLCKNAFMDFPDYDAENPFTNLADALTVIIWDSLQLDCDSSEIYDFLQSKLKN